MELASPFPEEPVSQIDADDAADLDPDIHSYERPLAASPFGTIELIPD